MSTLVLFVRPSAGSFARLLESLSLGRAFARLLLFACSFASSSAFKTFIDELNISITIILLSLLLLILILKMKYLLIGNSNAMRASNIFITKDHALHKERRILKCTSATQFKLQVKIKNNLNIAYIRQSTIIGDQA